MESLPLPEALAAGNPSREEYAALIRSFIAPPRRG